MTRYNVHLYREMRLLFTDIEAEGPQHAVRIAASKPATAADLVEDCDGEDRAALVDVVGDTEYEQSTLFDPIEKARPP